MTRVGFIGAGRMGEPMVERLLSAGHEVTVYARRPELRQRLAARGAVVVDDAVDAASTAEVFLSCLFSDPQLEETGPRVVAALPAGAVFASHTTGSVSLLRQLAGAGSARDVAVVDAPVSGTDTDIRAGRLTVLLGGPGTAVDAVADIVASFADPVLRTGELGSGLAVKLVNNLMFAAQIQTAAAAVHLARDLGVAQEALVEALGHSSGGSTALRYLGGADPADFGARISEFMAKDVAACEATARELGVTPEFLFDIVRSGPLPLTSGTPAAR